MFFGINSFDLKEFCLNFDHIFIDKAFTFNACQTFFSLSANFSYSIVWNQHSSCWLKIAKECYHLICTLRIESYGEITKINIEAFSISNGNLRPTLHMNGLYLKHENKRKNSNDFTLAPEVTKEEFWTFIAATKAVIICKKHVTILIHKHFSSFFFKF